MAMAETSEAFDLDQQYLTFILDGETYGLDVLQVQEIRAWESTRPIPEAPAYIKGVLDLRGTIVPIIDLRTRFNIAPVEYTATTVIIVISICASDSSEVVGIIVDGVSDVLSIDSQQMRPPPKLGGQINTEFMVGMVSTDDVMVMLLDTRRLFDASALESLEQIDR